MLQRDQQDHPEWSVHRILSPARCQAKILYN